MSIILDALKKSESDQQRQTGPALFEVKVAPPKARFPVWAIALAVLLGINMIIVGWLLLRPGHSDTPATTAQTPAAQGQAAQGSTPQQLAGAQQNAPSAAAMGGQVPSMPVPATQLGNAPPNTPNMSQAQWSGGQQQPYYGGQNASQPGGAPQYSRSAGGGMQQGDPQQNGMAGGNMPPTGAGGSNMPPTGGAGSNMNPAGAGGPNAPPNSAMTQRSSTPNDTDSREPTLANSNSGNPDDNAPAQDPGNSSLFKGHVKRGTESGVPLYQDAALLPGANLPQLRLDLHVYAANPPDRFALINMHKMHEGDSMPEGVHVDNITPDGVILSHNGMKFLLPRE